VPPHLSFTELQILLLYCIRHLHFFILWVCCRCIIILWFVPLLLCSLLLLLQVYLFFSFPRCHLTFKRWEKGRHTCNKKKKKKKRHRKGSGEKRSLVPNSKLTENFFLSGTEIRWVVPYPISFRLLSHVPFSRHVPNVSTPFSIVIARIPRLNALNHAFSTRF